jgi:hypothetical protein
MEPIENTYKILVKNQKGRDRLGYIGLYGRIILKCMLNRI